MFQNPQRYTKTRFLGSGHFGKVYLVTPINPVHDQPSQYAMKVLKHTSIESQTEQAILKSLRHPNILRIYENYKQNDNTVMILEFAQKGDLFQYSKQNQQLSQQQLANWIAQITLGLDYLHNTAHIIHRDVKLHNILMMQNGLLKLADFGTAKRLDKEEFAKTSIGTPYYLSPEMLRCSQSNSKTDIWGLGCVLYQLCSGSRPFKSKHFLPLMEQILYENSLQIPHNFPEWLRELVSSMLAKDANDRPDTKKILAIKQIQKAVLKLKDLYPNQYKDIIEMQIPKTTKYLERQQPHFNMPLKIAESLKTAKRSQKPKPQNLRASSRQSKIDDRFYNRSLLYLVQQSQLLHQFQQ